MKAKQLYFGLVSLAIVLVIGLFGCAVATNKILGGQANTLSKLRADSDALDQTQTTLAKNKQDIKKYSSLNTIAETIVPQDKDQAEAVREIVNLAAASGIQKLSSITFPSSSLGAITGTGTSANSNLSQLTPVKSIPGVYELPITVSQEATNLVPYSQFITFLSKLEQNRRTAQVSSISVTPNADKPGMVSFDLILNEFIKP